MSITITPFSPRAIGYYRGRRELHVPVDSHEDRFHLAISDGTLITGGYAPEDDRFNYQVEVERANITRIAGNAMIVDWRPEWVTIGVYQPVPPRAIEPFPLFGSA